MGASENVYKIEKDQHGTIITIARSDGTDVPIDPDDPLYCDFVNWAAQQSTPVARSYDVVSKSARYTCNISDVLEFLRNSSSLLFVEGADPNRELQSSDRVELLHAAIVNGSHRSGPTVRLIRLHIATPVDATWSQQIRDGITWSQSPLFVGPKLLQKLNQVLQDELSELRCRSSWPVNRTFVYFD